MSGFGVAPSYLQHPTWVESGDRAPQATYCASVYRVCVVSQRLCVGSLLPSQTMCARKDALLRVGPFIIVRRYT